MAFITGAVNVAFDESPPPSLTDSARAVWATSIVLTASWFVLPCCAPIHSKFITWLTKYAPWRDSVNKKGNALILIDASFPAADPTKENHAREKLQGTISPRLRQNDWSGWIDDRTFAIALTRCSKKESGKCADRLLRSLLKDLFPKGVGYEVRHSGATPQTPWKELFETARQSPGIRHLARTTGPQKTQRSNHSIFSISFHRSRSNKLTMIKLFRWRSRKNTDR